MPIQRYLELVFYAALVTASSASIAQRESDPLAPIVRCVQDGKFKVELSVPSYASADREAVEGQMQAFSSRRSTDQTELQRTFAPGVEVLSLHQPNLTRRGPLSFYSMFMPTKSIIATLYVLNQQPEGRAFSTFTEYEVLREDAANLVLGCLSASGT